MKIVSASSIERLADYLVLIIAFGTQATGKLQLTVHGFFLIGIFVLFKAPEIFRKVFNWKLWLAVLLVATTIGLLLGKNPDFHFLSFTFSWAGLFAGMNLVLRAITFILALSFFVSLVAKPDPSLFLHKHGFHKLSSVLLILGNTIPICIKSLSEQSSKIGLNPKSLYTFIIELIAAACHAVCALKTQKEKISLSAPLKILIITSSVGTGKTTFLQKLISTCRGKKLPTDGIMQLPKHLDGNFIGHEILILGSAKLVPFTQKIKQKTPFDSSYRFEPKGFLIANDTISKLYVGNIHIIDELGRLEARGAGHLPGVINSINRLRGTWILSVRKNKLKEITARLPQCTKHIIDLDKKGATAGALNVRAMEFLENALRASV